jgi:lipopolysaccharide transport system ATP-binding protein
MPPAIKVSGLSKLYQVGARQQGYKTLRESLADAFWSPVNRIRKSFVQRDLADGAEGQTEDRGQRSEVSKSSPEPRTLNPEPSARLSGENFWALKDVSFEVQPGEVVGIIGRNGAGKSTLLKVLSRITEPTSGNIELRGRVGSLLEVGTGFHPELTGRENIYMNGSILGMSRREIHRKFDEIVAFSEIEDFLDTPVKRYSSGMYVRLAFAVAAHLEPEILIVDEVLAVGDASFQDKCIRKMREVSSHGRTVLFVSHNMVAVQSLCTRGVILEQGRVTFTGDAKEAVTAYHDRIHVLKDRAGHRFRLTGNVTKHHPDLAIHEVRILSGGEIRDAGYPIGAPLEIELDCTAKAPLVQPVFGIRISRVAGPHVTTLHSRRSGACLPPSLLGDFTIRCSLSELLLPAGDYLLHLGIKSGNTWQYVADDAATFTILPTDFFGTGIPPNASDEAVLCQQRWVTVKRDTQRKAFPALA